MNRTLLCVGPLGPPATGATIVTERFLGELDDDIEVTQFNIGATTGRGRLWRQPGRLLAAVRAAFMTVRRDPTAVYISVPAGISAILLAPLLLAVWATRTPTYLHHHSFAYLNQPQLLFSTLFRIAGHAVHIGLCDRMEEQLRSVYPRVGAVHIVSNAAFVPPGASRPTTDDRNTSVRLAHLSNLSVEKGLERVLAAAVELNESGCDADLRLGGPATGEREIALIASYMNQLGPKLEVLGPIAQSNLDDFFSEVDVFVFPSQYRNEAQPLVVLEALAHGVPCITSTVGCLGTNEAVTSLRVLDAPTMTRAIIERRTEHDPIRNYADQHRAARSSLLNLLEGLDGQHPALRSPTSRNDMPAPGNRTSVD